MGIKNLNKLLIQENAIIYHNSLKEFRKTSENINKKLVVAIDTNLYYYKYLKSSLQNPFSGFLIQIKNFQKNNITPLYILDGKSPIEKNFLIEKRKKNNSVYIPYNDIKIFFDILNIDYIHSEEESDKFVGILYQKNIIDYCLTDDLDILLYHCKKVISIKKGIILEYDLDFILKKLFLYEDKFIYMCILMGCDYIKPKLNIPYINIWEMVKKFEIEQYQNHLLNNYSSQKNKINFIFSIINNIYHIFRYDISLYKNLYFKLNDKKKKEKNFFKKFKIIQNEYIQKIPYHLILYIYKHRFI